MASRKKPQQRTVMDALGYRGGTDKPRKKLVVKYDKQGNVIGDDGYEMTKARKRMHRIFDGWFIYIFVMVVAAFVLMLLAWQQGAQFTSWDSGQHGGNQFNGFDTAVLMRLEALLCLYTAVLAALISVFGFRWFYDRKPASVVYGLMFALAAVGIGYFAYGLVAVKIFEPLSLVNLCFILITLLTMQAVKAERPTLRKPKVGRKEER